MGDEVLELDTRRRIYNHISKVPGTHFREIHRVLNIPTGVVEYHLKYLENKDMIVAKREGRYKRYYVVGKVGSVEKKILSLLRQEIPRRILMHLLLNPGTKFKELRALFDISPSTLSFHIKKLVDAELIVQERRGKSTQYRVLDEDLVAKSLLSYQEGFMDDIVDSFAEAWLDIHP